MTGGDRAAVHDLLVGYFCGFDERRTDDEFLRDTFTADAHWRLRRPELDLVWTDGDPPG